MLSFRFKQNPKASLIPPCPHLLETNNPPNEVDTFAIRKAIAEAQNELDHILLALNRRRVVEVSKFIQAHRALLSSVRRIPFEVLVPIFLYVFLDEVIHVNHPPFLLAHVCRFWRGIILNRNMLALATIPPPLQLAHSYSRVVRSSVDSPISFHVFDHTKDTYHPALEALIQRATSWKHVSVDLNISSLRFLDENLDPRRVQNLTRLHLKVASSFACSASVFRHLPALTDVAIESQQKLLITLPWKHIKSYRERSWFDIGVSIVLRYADGLQYFTYSTSNPSPFVSPPLPSTLPHLKVLDVKIYHDDHTVAFRLTTPVLEEFILRDRTNGSIDRIRDHLRRSSCGHTLKRLAFHVGTFKPDILTQILSSLANLEELECDDIPAKDLQRLGREQPTRLVPRLRKLVVHTCLNALAIDDLITSRSQFQPTEHTLLGSKKPGLDHVSLVFSNPDPCDVAAVALGIQDPSPRSELIKMRKAVAQLDLICKSGLSEMDTQKSSAVKKVMSKLETFAFQNLREIDLRAVHGLKRFWWFASEKGKYTDRARTLWHVWRSILLIQSREGPRIRWIRDESNSLLYLKAVEEDRSAFERDLLSVRWQGFSTSWPYAVDGGAGVS